MKFKKLILFLILPVLAIAYYFEKTKLNNSHFLTLNHNSAKKIILSVRGVSEKIVLNELRINKPSSQDTKVSKAIESIKNKSSTRKPSNLARSILPENLISNELLKNTNWKIWAYTETILKTDRSQSENILSEIGNRYIVQSQLENTDLSEFDSKKLIILFDSKRNKVGLLTGQIQIITLRKDLLANELKVLNSQISNSFDSINTYFISNENQVFDLKKVYNYLKVLSFVQSVELDVIDRTYEKN